MSRPRLLPIASLLSFTLFLLTTLLWIRSHYTTDILHRFRGQYRDPVFTYTYLRLSSNFGGLNFHHKRMHFPTYPKDIASVVARYHEDLPDCDVDCGHMTYASGAAYNPHALNTCFPTPQSIWNRAGFELYSYPEADGDPNSPLTIASITSGLTLPHYAPATLFLLLPTLTTFRFLRHHRRLRAHHCPTCNYDLRVQRALSERSHSNGSEQSKSNGSEPSAPSPQCPECGTRILITLTK